MEEAQIIDDQSGPPAVVAIAARIGFAKAAFEGFFAILAIAIAASVGDDFGFAALIFAICVAVASWLLLRASRLGLYASVVLSAVGLAVAVIYAFRATEVVVFAVILVAGLNALMLYLLLGTDSARKYFAG